MLFELFITFYRKIYIFDVSSFIEHRAKMTSFFQITQKTPWSAETSSYLIILGKSMQNVPVLCGKMKKKGFYPCKSWSGTKDNFNVFFFTFSHSTVFSKYVFIHLYWTLPGIRFVHFLVSILFCFLHLWYDRWISARSTSWEHNRSSFLYILNHSIDSLKKAIESSWLKLINIWEITLQHQIMYLYSEKNNSLNIVTKMCFRNVFVYIVIQNWRKLDVPVNIKQCIYHVLL